MSPKPPPTFVLSLERRGHRVIFLTPRSQYPNWLFPGASDRDPDACSQLDCAVRCLEPLNPLSWPASRRQALAFDADAWIVPYWDLGLGRAVALLVARHAPARGGGGPQPDGSRCGPPAPTGGADGPRPLPGSFHARTLARKFPRRNLSRGSRRRPTRYRRPRLGRCRRKKRRVKPWGCPVNAEWRYFLG